MKKPLASLYTNLKISKWDIPELRKLLEEIIPENNFFEDYEVEYNFGKEGRKKLFLNAREIFQENNRISTNSACNSKTK